MANKRYEGKRLEKRKPWEFSKKLAVWAIVIATLSLVASVALSVFDKQPLTDLTAAIFTGCIGYLVTYAAKSATEKISRNRHGLDPDGNPYETAATEMEDMNNE